MVIKCLREFVDAMSRGGYCRHHLDGVDTPPLLHAQDSLNLQFCAVGTISIGFIDHEHIGNFHNTSLHRLDIVA